MEQNTPSAEGSARKNFITATVVVIAAALIRLAFDPVLGRHLPFLIFNFPVLIMAWYAGYRTGLVSLVLGFAGGLFFVMRHGDLAALDLAHKLDIIRFVVLGGGLCIVGGWMHAERIAAQRKSVEALELLRNMSQENLARRSAELDARGEKELMRAALTLVGEGVITTDREARITYLNDTAATFTGWTLKEAVGLPVSRIFRMVNGTPGKPSGDPVERALREDTIIGPIDHAMLIARDGTARAIENSATPIHDERGTSIGCVLVFHQAEKR